MKQRRIAILFKSTAEFAIYEAAQKKVGSSVDFFTYNDVRFSSTDCEVFLKDTPVKSYDIIFFRTIGVHYEEVGLILGNTSPDTIILDPLTKNCRPTETRKAYQMISLPKSGFSVPETYYGDLPYIKQLTFEKDKFPCIIKGSCGDRGQTVHIINRNEDIEIVFNKLLLDNNFEKGQRFMLQEFIPNTGDYRIIVLGDVVIGCVKRSTQKKGEFRNNMSRGGQSEVVQLPINILETAKLAAQSYGLFLAGVDIVLKDGDVNKPYFWEINYAPQYKKFSEATGINVPEMILNKLTTITQEEYSRIYRKNL